MQNEAKEAAGKGQCSRRTRSYWCGGPPARDGFYRTRCRCWPAPCKAAPLQTAATLLPSRPDPSWPLRQHQHLKSIPITAGGGLPHNCANVSAFEDTQPLSQCSVQLESAQENVSAGHIRSAEQGWQGGRKRRKAGGLALPSMQLLSAAAPPPPAPPPAAAPAAAAAEQQNPLVSTR